MRDNYRDKVEESLERQIEKGEQMYKEILARLPDVNVRLKGDV